MKNFLIKQYRNNNIQAFLICLMFFAPFTSYSQTPTLPNSGFEQWQSHAGPDTFLSYATSNGHSHYLAGEAAVWSVPGRTGKAVHLEAREANPSLTIPGSIALGTFCDGNIKSGMYYPYNPDTLSFWVRHDIKHGDRGLFFLMYKGGRDSITTFRSFIGTQSTWQQITLLLAPRPVGYDTITFAAYSSDPNAGIDGSWLEIDDMELKGGGGPGLPNGSFEIMANVGYEEPKYWGTPNVPSIWFSHVQSVTKTTDAAEGNYAIRLESTAIEFDCMPDTIGSLNSGKNYNGDPTKPYAVDQASFPFVIEGKYKYQSAGVDQGVVAVLFYTYDNNGNANVVEVAATGLPPTNSYDDFNVFIDSTGWGVVPDSFHLIFSPSLAILTGQGNAPVGSVLKLDDLTMRPGYPESISTESQSFNFRVYPNPAKDYVNLDWEGTRRGVYNISVINPQGRILRDVTFQGTHKTSLSLEGLSPGLYLVILKNEQGHSSIKQIIVQ